jgi:hypothetical protein
MQTPCKLHENFVHSLCSLYIHAVGTEYHGAARTRRLRRLAGWARAPGPPLSSRRPYCIENAGSHPNSVAKRCKAGSVLGWGTAREHHGVDGFLFPRASDACPDSWRKLSGYPAPRGLSEIFQGEIINFLQCDMQHLLFRTFIEAPE